MSRRSLWHYQQHWPFAALLERRLHTKMDAVIGNSKAVVRQLIEEGIPEAKVRLIYNGIEVSNALPDRAEVRRALGIDDDTLVGVVIANLIHYKGHRELVSGLSHVEKALPSKWRILVAGRDHGMRSELEVLAKTLGVSHRICFLCQRSDIPALLSAADFGLLTSREEGFSNVILEGMAAGLAADRILDKVEQLDVRPVRPAGAAVGGGFISRLLRAARRWPLRPSNAKKDERTIQKFPGVAEEEIRGRSRNGPMPGPRASAADYPPPRSALGAPLAVHRTCRRRSMEPQSSQSFQDFRLARDEHIRQIRVRHVTGLSIAGRGVGPGNPALIIAEIAQAHDGSLGLAHAFIDAVADAGADAVKFQTHIAAAESTLDEPFRVRFSQQDATRFDYWQRMEFTPGQWQGLAAHARECGLVFLSSAFSMPAIDLLRSIGMPAWKIGSGEFASADLWRAMAANGAPILFSTGMSKRTEIADAVAMFRSLGLPFALMQCTSAYPTPLETVGLNVIDELRREFDCPVGLSDHSGSVFPGLAALARGANLLEVHVTFHRRMFGPDVAASVTFDELKLLCQMRDALSTMDSHPVDKDAMAEKLLEMREIFSKSLAPICPLPAGTVLGPEMIVSKKPGGGIPLEAAGQIAGRRLARDVVPERILRWDDLEEGS